MPCQLHSAAAPRAADRDRRLFEHLPSGASMARTRPLVRFVPPQLREHWLSAARRPCAPAPAKRPAAFGRASLLQPVHCRSTVASLRSPPHIHFGGLHDQREQGTPPGERRCSQILSAMHSATMSGIATVHRSPVRSKYGGTVIGSIIAAGGGRSGMHWCRRSRTNSTVRC